MTPRLRPASPTDLPVLLPLMAQFYAHFQYRFESARHEAVARRFLTDPNLGSLWLIEVDSAPVGYVAVPYGYTFEFGGRDGWVDELFVVESHRSLGLGGWALAELQRRADELGLVAIHLQTEHYNERAKKLYESLGFRNLQRSTLTWLNQS